MDNQKLSARLSALAEKATKGPWRVGADLIRVHPHSLSAFHKNGFAYTIATVGREGKDWRGIEQQCSDAALIVELVNNLPTIISALQKEDL